MDGWILLQSTGRQLCSDCALCRPRPRRCASACSVALGGAPRQDLAVIAPGEQLLIKAAVLAAVDGAVVPLAQQLQQLPAPQVKYLDMGHRWAGGGGLGRTAGVRGERCGKKPVRATQQLPSTAFVSSRLKHTPIQAETVGHLTCPSCSLMATLSCPLALLFLTFAK